MLRAWREDFAQAMRTQGVAANATPRAWRGQSKRATRDRAYRAEKRGRSDFLRARVRGIAAEIAKTDTVRDPARAKLVESRKAVVAGWYGIATALDNQGEIVLAGDVRYFANHLPKVLTDRERLALDFIAYVNRLRVKGQGDDRVREQKPERTR
jgi:hypothetical protein